MPLAEKIKGKDSFFIQLKNNTSQALPVVLFDIFGSQENNNAIPGDFPVYTFDVTNLIVDSVAKNLYTLAVLAAPYSTGIYQLFTADNAGNASFATATQIVNTLNTMGIGQFSVVAGNIISISTRQYILSSINVTDLEDAAHSTTFGTDFTLGGSLIYDPGYSSGLIGSFIQIPTGNAFWINTPGNFDGPYNRSNIYANKNDTIDRGFFANITVSSARTVYIGVSFSNRFGGNNLSSNAILYLNSTKIIDISSGATLTALAADVNTQLGSAYTANQITYTCWFIFPVNLVAGNNLIQMKDDANGATQTNVMGLEVYDNTDTEIKAATSYNQLNVLFSTIDYLNKPLF